MNDEWRRLAQAGRGGDEGELAAQPRIQLLDQARARQSAGFRPARSVLFAAWSAKELDRDGVTHYLAHPAVPLTQTPVGLQRRDPDPGRLVAGKPVGLVSTSRLPRCAIWDIFC